MELLEDERLAAGRLAMPFVTKVEKPSDGSGLTQHINARFIL